MTPLPNICERVTVSESEPPGTVLEENELWSVAFRKRGEDGWHKQGVESADAAAVLRILDYWDDDPTMENRLLKTKVIVEVEDPILLREKLKKESVAESGADVHSE